MDIRDWPLDQVMQLPDCCFGRRWPIHLFSEEAINPAMFRISHMALPEQCVIWEVTAWGVSGFTAAIAVGLALGDFLPTTEAEWQRLELVFSGFEDHGHISGELPVFANGQVAFRQLKMHIRPAGRRLVGRFAVYVGVPDFAGIGVTVSSIPHEVPDCLVSEYLRSQL